MLLERGKNGYSPHKGKGIFGDACVFDCECVIVLELGLAAHHVEREILLNAVFSPIEGL